MYIWAEFEQLTGDNQKIFLRKFRDSEYVNLVCLDDWQKEIVELLLRKVE